MNKYQLAVVVTALLAALSGCTGNQEAGTSVSTVSRETSIPEVGTVYQQKLQFTVVESESPGYTLVSQEELGGIADVHIAYGNLTEVNITWGGENISLAEAIREGNLSVPEIFAFARMDAQNGFCRETYVSEHGLTHFCYTYPECELWIVYDAYETPDGKQTVINQISIYNITDSERNVGSTYIDEASEWGYFLDREDWGLTFKVSSVTSTQITVDYTQIQKQEIGELSLVDYELYSREDGDTSEYLARSERDVDGLPISIHSDGSGQMIFDWSDTVGALESGEYYLKVTVSDNYDESDVHPLMANFYDKQSYHIVFTIDEQ